MSDNKKVMVSFRTTTEMKEKIEAIAAKEKRTLSNMIEVLLDKAIESFKKK